MKGGDSEASTTYRIRIGHHVHPPYGLTESMPHLPMPEAEPEWLVGRQ